jgi:hypothetical protein
VLVAVGVAVQATEARVEEVEELMLELSYPLRLAKATM